MTGGENDGDVQGTSHTQKTTDDTGRWASGRLLSRSRVSAKGSKTTRRASLSWMVCADFHVVGELEGLLAARNDLAVVIDGFELGEDDDLVQVGPLGL